MFKNIFKAKSRKKRFLKKDNHVHHDWVIALLVFMIVTILAVIASGIIFVRINVTEEIDTGVLDTGDLIDKELLDKTLEHFNNKEEIYLRYQNTVPIAPEL